MPKYIAMGFIDELQWRGMLHDMTPGIEDVLAQKKVLGYIGFDPTAPSLTIGNYIQIMILNFFQQHGHTPIVLLGGATGRIGDPSGKSKERILKSYQELDDNLQHQKNQFEQLLNFNNGENKAFFVNNYDFYKSFNVLDFLRDAGKTLTVNYMLAKDSVKNRIDSGISFTEFSYQLLQAYDFQQLYEKHDCILQMGGSDQWGNITSGTEFIRRNLGAKAYAITTPLLTKSDGTKFGKSAEGNIWLDPDLTTPYQFYQFWLRADDQDMSKFFRYFSFKDQLEIESIEKLEDPRAIKKALAEELTMRIHGEKNFKSVQRVSELLFNNKTNADFLISLEESEWNAVGKEIPMFEVNIETEAVGLIDCLAQKTQVFQSNGDLRRAIKNNALSINKVKLNDPYTEITSEFWLKGKYMLVENGKKNKYLIKKS